MNNPVVLDACTIVNLARIDENDFLENLFRIFATGIIRNRITETNFSKLILRNLSQFSFLSYVSLATLSLKLGGSGREMAKNQRFQEITDQHREQDWAVVKKGWRKINDP